MDIKQLKIDSIKLDKKNIDHNETYGDLYEKCIYFWENQDDEYMNCGGEAIICHEFISVKESIDNEH